MLWRTLRPTLTASVFALLAAAACAPAQPASPTPGRTQAPVAAKPAEKAAPAASPAAASQQKPAPKPSWQEEWARLEEAARKEGKLVLGISPSEAWRGGISSLWERDYPQIQLELTGLDGRDFWPKVQAERDAGLYLWDLRVGGADEYVFTYKHEWLDPVRPMLFHPDVVDDSRWIGGLNKLFADNGKQYAPAFTSYMNAVAKVNRDFVPLPDMRSEKELLDPKWKGRIIIQDLRGGSGLSLMSVMLAHNGEGFIRDLLTQQEPVVSNNSRQMTEFVIRGRYPIGVGVSEVQLASFEEQGVKANIQNIPEGPRSLAIGVGAVVRINRGPNHNAAKLFVNWLLTRDIQQPLLERVRLNSRRTDVPTIDPGLAIDPEKLNVAYETQFEDFLPFRQRLQQIGQELGHG